MSAKGQKRTFTTRLGAKQEKLHEDLEMPNLESRHRFRSSPDQERWTRSLHVASTVCVASALWIVGIIASSSTIAGTLDDVRARGTLICGVSEGLPGFSEKHSSGVWRGFDVDFCKAVAAA